MSKPLWLQRMTAKQKARMLGKVYAVIREFEAEHVRDYNLEHVARGVWMLKSYYEGEAKEGK